MTQFEFKLPENGNLSQALVASAISNLAIHTDCEVNVYSTNASNAVNAKSLLGLFTIQLTAGSTLHFSVIGETETYTAQSIQRKLGTLFSAKLYKRDKDLFITLFYVLTSIKKYK